MSQKIRQDATLGKRIRQLRKEQHLTQEDVTLKMQLQGCNITRSIYAQIECGTYNIRVSELMYLADILKCDMNTLFTFSDSVSSKAVK